MACGEKLSPEEVALAEAKKTVQTSYEQLLAGNYDSFLEGRSGNSSLPENYREQLRASCKQFIAQQEKLHHGIRSFSVSNARIDSAQQLILVFLVLNYGDSTQEEIVVPMTEQDGAWKMK
jgi:hypothetical protein